MFQTLHIWCIIYQNNKHSCRNRPRLLDKFITDLNNNFNGFML